ncbi:putative thioesterase family protein [Neofusicoccum parvum UCRNP2]|uniref:Putative thioesterase family protein n=1 Tax=Botryosphaeria parva (strain UCR-NP2) TaxID=1287680 RepID=R1GH63_BOTPV|nr:putative thioesterase family protein [Neofusicoccum parvum UCRNP2]
MAPTFADATAVAAVGSHTYSANFYTDWSVGSVPHGGFVTSVFLRVASTHFGTTLAAQNQPHTITLHLEFLRRTQEGPATFKVKDAKLGRQTSTIHVSLVQDGREEVVGYITNSNIDAEDGVSFETGWALHPASPPVDLARLADDKDANWAEMTEKPFPKFRKVTNRVRMYLPRRGQAMTSVCDEWIRLESGERWTNEGIGLVSDLWPQIIEEFRREEKNAAPFWYPTLLLNLDIKKSLPEEGTEWLFARVRAKKIKNGRQDLEVVIHDASGDIVALSHHVGLVLSAERNMAKRRTKEGSKM